MAKRPVRLRRVSLMRFSSRIGTQRVGVRRGSARSPVTGSMVRPDGLGRASIGLDRAAGHRVDRACRWPDRSCGRRGIDRAAGRGIEGAPVARSTARVDCGSAPTAARVRPRADSQHRRPRRAHPPTDRRDGCRADARRREARGVARDIFTLHRRALFRTFRRGRARRQRALATPHRAGEPHAAEPEDQQDHAGQRRHHLPEARRVPASEARAARPASPRPIATRHAPTPSRPSLSTRRRQPHETHSHANPISAMPNNCPANAGCT